MDSLRLRLKNHLQAHRYSLTKQRLTVFKALRDTEPQTIQQLVAACPDVDRASVYRTVALFEQLGIAQRLQIGWKYKLELSDAFSHHHHHMTCRRCGRTFAFDESPELERELQRITADSNFQMQSHQLEIQGLCAPCANERGHAAPDATPRTTSR